MIRKPIRAFYPYRFLTLLGLLWMLLWVAPWTSWLGPFPWVRMGLSILIFCVPGMIISLLLLGKKLTLLAHLTSGVAISVFLVGFLGMLGRTFNLPYAFIKPVFAVMGLAALFGLISRLRTDPELYKPKHFSLLASALLLFLFAFGILINLQSIFGGDDSSYLAYLTNWQHARPLNFEEVVFGSGDTDSIRFWLGMFPMSLAFLAELSKLHGLLLLGLYLEPYLVVIAILAIYNLYEVFLGEERLTIAALLLHFTFFVLLQGARQPGNVFFIRLSEDKVFAAFILAPALFLGVRHFLEASTLRAGIFVFLNGLSLALTHPIILAFSLFIACLYVILVTMVEKNQRTFGFAITLLIIPVIPSVLFRFIDGPQTQRYPVNLQSALDAYGSASETRFSYIAGTPFYGFDLGRIKIQTSEAEQENPLEIFLSWSYLWVLGTGFLWSLFHWRRKRATAPFMAATSGLVLLCGLPFTGWLLGYFVTAGMLWRSPWLLPIGFIGVIVLTELLNFILQGIADRVEIKKFSEQVAFTSITVICSILLVNFSIHGYHSRQPLMIRPEGYAARLENLATLGNYLQNHLQQPAIFVAPLELMDYLPGLSSKAKVVFFRTSRYTPHPVDTKQLSLIFSRDPSILIQERMSILRMYDVQFIVIEDPVLREYYAHYTEFSNAQKVKNFWVIEFRDLSLSSHLPKVSSVMDHDKGRLLCEIEELKLRKN